MKSELAKQLDNLTSMVFDMGLMLSKSEIENLTDVEIHSFVKLEIACSLYSKLPRAKTLKSEIEKNMQ